MEKRSNLLFDISPDQVPIIYSPHYDIRCFGIENLHPFDTRKWGRTHEQLLEHGLIKSGQSVEPRPAEQSDLLRVHTEEYLNSLNSSCTVARIAEVCPLALLPNFLLRRRLLLPLRYQTGGSVLGTKLARERGWSINLGGGFHHCSGSRGGGFCFYADISLCTQFLLDDVPEVERIMIIDLDAHQGNGYARDITADPIKRSKVFILDAYNPFIYPGDTYAKSIVRCPVLLRPRIKDKEYLQLIETQVQTSLSNFPPDFVIYNAGTDILEGDPLGRLSISPNGIVERDRLIFSQCRKRNIPILMLTSGGYLNQNYAVISNSIESLVLNGVINF